MLGVAECKYLAWHHLLSMGLRHVARGDNRDSDDEQYNVCIQYLIQFSSVTLILGRSVILPYTKNQFVPISASSSCIS